MIFSAREEVFEALEGYRAACSRFDYAEPNLVDAAALEVTAAWLRLRAAIRKAKGVGACETGCNLEDVSSVGNDQPDARLHIRC